MSSSDPYQTPRADVEIDERTSGRHWLVQDILVAVVALLISIWALSQLRTGYSIAPFALGLLYFAISVCVLRGYWLARYLLFANGLLVLAGPAYYLYLGGSLKPLLVLFQLGFALASFGYGWARYRHRRRGFVLKREILYLVAAVLIFIGLILLIEVVLPPANLSGPVRIN